MAALDSTVISFPLSGPLNTHDDVKLIDAPQMADVVDGVYRKGGTVTERPGFDLISGPGDGALSVFSCRDRTQRLARADENLYAYLQQTDTWLDRGALAPTHAVAKPVQRSYGNHLFCDAVPFNNNLFSLIAWENLEDGTSYIEYKIVERATGTVYVGPERLEAGTAPRCVYDTTLGVSLWYISASGNLKRIQFDAANPSSAPIVFSPASGVSPTRAFDVIAESGAIYAVWEDAATQIPMIGRSQSTGTFNVIEEITTLGAGPWECAGLQTTSTRILVAMSTGAPAVSVAAITKISLSIGALTQTSAFTDPVMSTQVEWTSGSTFFVKVSTRNSSTGARTLWRLTGTLSGSSVVALSSAVRVRHHVNLASKTINTVIGGNTVNVGAYVQGVMDDPSQYTAFFGFLSAGTTPDLIRSRYHVGVSGNTTLPGPLPSMHAVDDDVHECAALIQTEARVDDTQKFYTVAGTDLVTFTPIEFYSTAEIADTLHFSGGAVMSYDGGILTEHGFFAIPYISDSTTGGSGSGLSTGLYTYAAVYEWENDNGEIMRSAPSILEQIDVTAGEEVTLTVSTLGLTNKRDDRQPVRIVIYRGVADNTEVLYRVSGSTVTTGDNRLVLNTTTTATVSFTDVLGDAAILGRDFIYTTGGVIENDCPPGFTYIASAKGRLWGIAQDDAKTLWVTKPLQMGVSPEFSALFSLRSDDNFGDFTALASMDDKLICFKSRAIYYIAGDGPDALGGGAFTSITRIASDVGCTEPASIAETSQGVYFKSAKGIFLLTRALELVYIGAAVHDYNAQAITGVSVAPDVNEVRFTTAESRALVYNYKFDRWATWRNHSSPSATTWGDSFVTIDSVGDIRVENETFSDNGSAISMELITAWIKLMNIHGFMRVWRAFVIGNSINSEHTLVLDFAYDYDDFFSESASINVADATDTDGYGEGGYGQGPYGGFDTDATYNFRFDLPRTRCSAVQIRLRVVPSTAQQNCEINAMSLEVGTIPGSARMRDKKHAE